MAQRRSLVLIAGALLLLSSACGGGGGANDQGTSFTALGFFEDGDATGDTLPAGDAGTLVFINETVPGSQGVFPLIVPVDKNPTEAGIQGGFIGLENRITTQHVRTVRMDCDYVVAGASINIPSDSWHFTSVVNAAQVTINQTTGAQETEPSRTFNQVEIVSPDIMSFLNNNRNSFPELPFRLTAICRVIGVTQAGDTLTTNDVFYSVQFSNEPSQGTQPGDFNTGPGTGGDLITFGDPDTTT